MAAGKNLINSIDNVVQESLTGHILTYPHLELHINKQVVLAPNWKKKRNNVAVICGGGSGHEPFASGFVGTGMLTASVAGAIYASPPSSNILHAITCVTSNNEGDCFVIIPNYTGDCLNFGIAIEKARSLNIKVDQVIVGEDCSIPLNEQGRAGQRGLCGLIFIIKIAGALAERGSKLTEISNYAELVVRNMATYGVGLKACSIPGKGIMFDIPSDEIEFGLGVHGEAGYKRIKLQSAKETVAQMLNEIIKKLNLDSNCSVAVLINNFGALSQLEQGIVTREAVIQLENQKIKVERVYSGFLMTSLDGSGIHITVLNLPQKEKELLLACLDDKTDAPRWPGCAYSLPFNNSLTSNVTNVPTVTGPSSSNILSNVRHLQEWEEQLLKKCIINASKAIIEHEEAINELDRGCGDGDCGSTLSQMAHGILSSLDIFTYKSLYDFFYILSQIAEEQMGGTSGALYSLMFTIAGTVFNEEINNQSLKKIWAKIFRACVNGIMKYGKAQIGDKTILDVLEPACQAFENNLHMSCKEIAFEILDMAKKGCEATKHMIPKAGRASYVKQKEYLSKVDAGAYGAVTWIQAVVDTLCRKL